MRSNNSFVYDLFQALYRSSLTCPGCERQSNTFDPFLSMSLPVPQKCKKAVYVTVVYLDARPRQVRIGLLMDLSDTVRELRHTLASDTNIPAEQVNMVLFYVHFVMPRKISAFYGMICSNVSLQNMFKISFSLLNIYFILHFQEKSLIYNDIVLPASFL